VLPAIADFDLRLTAAKLAEDFDYVCVELHVPDNDVFFGELTFTPGAGVLPMRCANVQPAQCIDVFIESKRLLPKRSHLWTGKSRPIENKESGLG
jgi:hypothetical protein